MTSEYYEKIEDIIFKYIKEQIVYCFIRCILYKSTYIFFVSLLYGYLPFGSDVTFQYDFAMSYIVLAITRIEINATTSLKFQKFSLLINFMGQIDLNN